RPVRRFQRWVPDQGQADWKCRELQRVSAAHQFLPAAPPKLQKQAPTRLLILTFLASSVYPKGGFGSTITRSGRFSGAVAWASYSKRMTRCSRDLQRSR